MQIRTYLSLFNGIGTGSQALKELGVSPNLTYVSEIDKFANMTNEKNHPQSINLGDVSNWREWDIDWSQVDVVTSGNPCTSFSSSGNRKGFRDPRGKLLWDALDIIHHILSHNPNAKWFIENVVMSSKLENEFSGYIAESLGTHYKEMINSSLVTAQGRSRYYWSNFELDQPSDCGIIWEDIKEDINEYFYTDKSLLWLENRNSNFDGVDSTRKKGTFNFDTSVVASMRGRYLVDGKRQDGRMKTAGLTTQYAEFRYDGKTNTLTTVAKDNIVVPFTLEERIPVDMFFFRYITPTEAERLQGFADGYTEGVSKTQRLKQLGNGWTLPVIVHIFKKMMEK